MNRLITTPKLGKHKEEQPPKTDKPVYPNPRIKEKQKLTMQLQSKRKLDNENQQVLSLSLDHEDEHLVTGDNQGSVRVFNLWTGKMINKLQVGTLPIQSLRFRPTQKYQLLSACCDGTLRLNHILTGKTLGEIKEEEENQVLTMDHIDEQFATGGSDQIIRLYDESTMQLVSRLKGQEFIDNSHNNRIYQVKYVNQHCLLSAGTDRNVLLWDTRSKSIQQSFGGPVVLGEQMDTLDHYLAVGSNSLQDPLSIYDLRNMSSKLKDVNKSLSPQEKEHFSGIDMVFSVSFSKHRKDITSLFVTSFDKVMLYDVEAGFKPYAEITQYEGSAYCAAVGRNSHKFVFGSTLGVSYYLSLKKKE